MYGVIDIGSNTVRLVVYRMREGKLTLHLSKKETLGLATYVDPEGNLLDEGIDNTIPVLKEFSKLAKRSRVKELYVIATASIRNVNNKINVLERLEKETDLTIDLLTGEQEAMCGFYGVMLQESFSSGIVVDIGGGSTEIVVCENGVISHSSAIPTGSLSSYVRHVGRILPDQEEVKEIKKDFEKQLNALGLSDTEITTIYAIGGTNRAVLKLNRHFFPEELPNNTISKDNLKALANKMLSKDKDVHVDLIRIIPERIHTILPGLTILRTLVKHFKADVVVVERYGVREGYLYQQLLKFNEVISMGPGNDFQD